MKSIRDCSDRMGAYRCPDPKCGEVFVTEQAMYGHWGASDCERGGRK